MINQRNMKKILLSILLLAAGAGAFAQPRALDTTPPLRLDTKNMTLLLSAREGQALRYVYLGERLSDKDLAGVLWLSG